jgi:hypothetical protein
MTKLTIKITSDSFVRGVLVDILTENILMFRHELNRTSSLFIEGQSLAFHQQQMDWWQRRAGALQNVLDSLQQAAVSNSVLTLRGTPSDLRQAFWAVCDARAEVQRQMDEIRHNPDLSELQKVRKCDRLAIRFAGSLMLKLRLRDAMAGKGIVPLEQTAE